MINTTARFITNYKGHHSINRGVLCFVFAIMIGLVPNLVLAERFESSFAELTYLENVIQSNISNSEIIVSDYTDDNRFIAKVARLFPLIESINQNQAEELRLNLVRYIGDKRIDLKNSDQSAISLKTDALPRLSASSYAIYDPAMDNFLLENELHKVRPIASISKLITAIVATEVFNENQQFVMTSLAKTVGSSSGLPIGAQFDLSNALTYLLIRSSNDVANQVQIAHDARFGRGSFVQLMNDKVRSIGLVDTNFNDPSGLSAGNQSTVHDLVRLLNHMMVEYPELIALSRQPVVKRGQTVLASSNPVRFNSRWLGGKNGYIKASGRTLASVFKIDNDREVIIVTLGSDYYDEGQDSIRLLNMVQ